MPASEPAANVHPVGPALGQDRATVLTGGVLLVVAALAWLVVIAQAMGMQRAPMAEPHTGMAVPMETAAAPLHRAAAFLIAWGIMMAAMMLPSAAPMIALYGAVQRNLSRTGQKGIPTALFALVYLALWLAFGIPVYAAMVAVDGAAAHNPAIMDLVPYAVAVVLLAAGLYQLSPLKRACLRVCRSPLGFLLGRWRSGCGNTLRLAVAHAAYCLGCCWALMAVLVAAGAMGLHWVLLVAALVFAEKVLPYGEWTARLGGIGLLLLGLLVVVQPSLSTTLRAGGM